MRTCHKNQINRNYPARIDKFVAARGVVPVCGTLGQMRDEDLGYNRLRLVSIEAPAITENGGHPKSNQGINRGLAE